MMMGHFWCLSLQITAQASATYTFLHESAFERPRSKCGRSLHATLPVYYALADRTRAWKIFISDMAHKS